MARRPTMSVRPDFLSDPLDDAVTQDRESIADALLQTLEQLGSVDQGTIKGILYRIPIPNGKYEWIRDVYPPFDMSEIMRSLKEDIGGGDFALRIMAEGKVRKTLHFAIMKDKMPLVAPQKDGSDMMAMFGMMMQLQTASSDRMMQMMMNSQQSQSSLLAAVLPAMMGGREKAADFIPLLAAMRGNEPPGNPMKEALETLTMAKGLFAGSGEGGPGFDADDLVGSVLKIAGPVAGAVGRAIQDRRAQNGAVAESPVQSESAAPLMIPAPRPELHDPNPAKPASRFPILDLIREDVLFMFKRNHDPARAAEVVFDTMDAHDVAEDDINGLVAAFSLSPDWLAELASEGIDLRSRPEWAEQFINALVLIHANAGGDDDAGERDEGRAPDVGDDGETGARRLAANGGP